MTTTTLPLTTRKPRRMTVTIPQHVYEALDARALYEGRSMSNLAAYLLEDGLRPPTSK